MKPEIEKAIRKAITRHLVVHVQTLGDTRDRIDILVEEAASEILKLVQPDINSVCECGERETGSVNSDYVHVKCGRRIV